MARRFKFATKALKALPAKPDRYEVADSERRGLRLRVAPSGDKTFCVLYRNGGKLIRYTIGPLGPLTVSQARDEADRIIGQSKRSDAPDPQAAKKAARIEAQRAAKVVSLKTYIAPDGEFAGRLRTEQRSADDTLRRVAAAFPDLLDKKLPAISRWDLRRWRKDRKDTGVSDFTIDRDLTALATVLTDAMQAGIITTHPVRRPADERRDELKPRLDVTKAPRHLAPEEQVKLRAALAARDVELRKSRDSGNRWRKVRDLPLLPARGKFADHITPMVLLVLNTGLRPGRELFELAWSDVNLSAKNLTVRGEIAKAGRSRVIPLNDEALRVLKDWRDVSASKSGLVFPSDEGRPFDNIKKAWATVTATAGLKKVPPYALRHSFATSLVQANVPLPTVQQLMGHGDLRVTSRYLHVTAGDLKRAVAALTPAAG